MRNYLRLPLPLLVAANVFATSPMTDLGVLDNPPYAADLYSVALLSSRDGRVIGINSKIASENGGDRLAIVIDMAFPWLSPGGQAPFFQNGEPTQATQQMIEFCALATNYDAIAAILAALRVPMDFPD